tara:strand:- start:5007 stop:5537 length:531 start_codon:yes stop_codon:yes gene_type:complete
MAQLGLFIIGAFAALFLVLAPPPAAAQMKMEGGHGAAHNQRGKPASAHGAHQADTRPTKIPEHLDVARTKFSEQAKFSVNVTSRLDPVTINKMHSWVLNLKNPDGKPVRDAKLDISGGMPMHGHGLSTAPRVTKNLGDGKYLIEGVRFNMAGWWELKIVIDSGHHKDNVTFNLILK